MAKREKRSEQTNKSKKPFYKKWWFIAIVALFSIGVIGNLTGSGETTKTVTKVEQKDTSKKESSSKTSSKKATKKSESKKKVPAKKAGAKYQKANAILESDLQQSKGWAKGELDENGNPTENGTPNSAYDWSLFVYKIEIKGENTVYGYVNADLFNQLNEDGKKEVAIKVQNNGVSALMQTEQISDEQTINGLMTWIKDENQTKTLGRSKLTNVKDFKWYK